MVKIGAKQKVSKELQDAVNEKEAYIQMYQSGFLDGWKHRQTMNKRDEVRLWNKICLFAKVAFEKRYFKKIEKVIKDGNKSMQGV